jgi:hypothetical protein
MIIYGTKAVKVKSENLFNVKCPSCGQSSSTEMYVFSKHFHLFWLPMFPIGKTGVAQCEHCKKVTAKKEMNGEMLEKYNELKSQTKPKIWQFAGLLLLAILIYAVSSSLAAETKREKEYLASPQAGDRYYLASLTPGFYTSFKIIKIEGDSVEVSLNMKETNKITAVASIDISENYIGLTEKYTKKQLTEMYSSGKIQDVIRK